jgi:uncharacterized protein YsxB (DUF464 family)
MICAEFYSDKSSGAISLKVEGHAGAAKKGKDIVCAAASVLAYTAAQAVQWQFEDGCLRKKPRIELDDGECIIVAKPKDEHYNIVLHTFWVAQTGFHLLSQSYPQFVELKSFGHAAE